MNRLKKVICKKLYLSLCNIRKNVLEKAVKDVDSAVVEYSDTEKTKEIFAVSKDKWEKETKLIQEEIKTLIEYIVNIQNLIKEDG